MMFAPGVAATGFAHIVGRIAGAARIILLCALAASAADVAAYNATFTQISTSNTPGAPPWRGWSVATWVGSIGKVVMWGGSGADFLDDIVAIDPATAAWTTLAPDAYCPGNTAFAPPNGSDENGLVWDPVQGRLWIYNGGSGYRCATPQNVTRTAGTGTTTTSIVDPTLSATTNYVDWQARAPDGGKTRVTAYNSSTKTLTLASAINVAAGGSYDLFVDFGDGTWSYNLSSGVYSKLQGAHWGYSGYVPPARKSPGFASDGTRAFLFGGLDYDNGLYKLDFSTGAYTVAIAQGSGASPAARGQIQAHFVYDSVHNKFVLFGGRCFDPSRCTYGGMMNDTWLYDSAANQWTQVSPALSPSPRNQALMYFDSALGVVVLYGGSNGSTVLNDLWTFDVGTGLWTQQAVPATNPGGLYLAQVAYAATTHCGYMIYGLTTGGTATGNTWKLCLAASGGNQPPNASFTATPSTAAIGVPIAFSAAASSDPDGSIVSYAWDFGDGTTGSGVSVNKSYATAGTYTVTLTVTDNAGATGSTTHTVTITAANQPPTANFTATPSPASVGTPVTFSGSTSVDPDGTIVGYAWNFGDGTTGSGVTVSKSYSTAGTYTVTLTVTDNLGATGSTSAAITVQGGGGTTVWVEDALPAGAVAGGSEPFTWITSNPAPYSGTKAHQSTIGSGIHQHYFTGARVGLPIGVGDRLFTYVYLDPANPPRQVMLQFYDAAGSWEHRAYWGASLIPWGGANMGALPPTGQWVRLEVAASLVNLEGKALFGVAYALYDGRATWDYTGRASAGNQPPVASFTATPSTTTVGSPIALSAAASSDPDGTIASYAWNFGDGTTGTGVSASKSYAAAGTYTITLTVTDNLGATGSTTKSVVINPPNQPPVASFTATPSTATVGSPIALSAAASSDPDGSIVSYAWNFGDGTNGTGVSASKTYAAAGTYTITLTVTDNLGATGSTTKSVVINPPNQPPVASFTATPSTATVGSPIALSAAASSDPDGSIVSYAWNFGDGTTGTGVSTSKTYAAAGTYTITLTVTDNLGATGSTTKSVTVTNASNQPPVASLTATPSATTVGVTIVMSGAGSSDPDGTIASYSWTFGDGTSGSGAVVSKSYSAAGTYTVTLKVTDNAGATSSTTSSVTIVNGGSTTIWVDDSLPGGAGTFGTEPFTWIASNPLPYSGTLAHQSTIAAGTHQHYFTVSGRSGFQVNTGARLFTYVYLDPANLPQQVMLQFYDGTSWTRAYWGANLISWGGQYMGPLPPAGVWVRLEIPASAIGLEGVKVLGVAYALYDGRATWDRTGLVAAPGS
jgi:PKD repeat protein